MIHMKNRLVGLLVFALVAFNLYAQSDQSKKGLLTFTGTRIISFDPMREMPKMAWYSENQDIRVDEEVLFNNLLVWNVTAVRAGKTFVWKCRLHVPRNFSFEYSVTGRPGFG